MRALLLVAWLLVPVVAAAWHFGPGQDYVQLEKAGAVQRRAEAAAAEKQYAAAVELYAQAIAALPADRAREARALRVQKAKAMMLARQLPEARAELDDLVASIQADAAPDAALLADARSALATSQYYMTWLMRLERQPRDLWEPEVEASRQNYRLLAEEAEARGELASAKQFREDVESAIRLARMDLGELQGLPLPNQ
jgi:hypothetical protein